MFFILHLTSMTNGTANESYTFDGVGNRTASHLSATYGYQAYNRMTSTASATMTYNANANLTQKIEGGTTWAYTWDYENRMTSAANGTATAQYSYDALGRRIRRVVVATGGDTKFIYDGFDVVMDDDATTGITKYQNGLGIDDKLSLKNGAVSKYFITDHLGSTVLLTDGSGAALEQNSYDSFGNRSNTSFSSRYQYTGREYDPLSGFYYYRARWYDANVGRFVSEDPIGFEGGDMNLYAYVSNRPLLFGDPLGEQVPGWDHYWYWYYSKKCAETGIENACAMNRSDGNPELLAQEAFNRGVSSVSALRFKVGYGENEYCRQAEYYAGSMYADTFPTNVQRIHPDGEVADTLENVAKTQPLGRLDGFGTG